MDWVDSVDEFLEIVDSLEAYGFATVPPVEQNVEVQPIVLQSNRAKLRIQTNITPVTTPNVRVSVGLKDLVSRVDALEETVALQYMQLHELYSFINIRLDKLEKIVGKCSSK
jgi:hypothetical protein